MSIWLIFDQMPSPHPPHLLRASTKLHEFLIFKKYNYKILQALGLELHTSNLPKSFIACSNTSALIDPFGLMKQNVYSASRKICKIQNDLLLNFVSNAHHHNFLTASKFLNEFLIFCIQRQSNFELLLVNFVVCSQYLHIV